MRIRAALVPSLVLALAGCHGARESDATPQPTAAPAHDEQAAAAQTVVAQKGTPRGYDHPDQYLTVTPTAPAPNLEPVVEHPEQEKQARARLDELQRKFGRPPNIVVFLLDDIGWMDFGFNGGGIAVGNDTPHIDRIAADSLILTSAYAQPSCSPTRATIMTGQYPLHHGILVPPMYGQPGGLEGAVTLAKLLSDRGYTTQAIGKWHMGENRGSQPQNVGFDDFRGFLSVSDMYTEWRDPEFNPEIALSPARTAYMERLPFDKDDVHAVKGGELETVQEINLSTIKNLDQAWAAYGEQFLRKAAHGTRPFFLYYATRGCHFDNYPNATYAGRSRARTVYSDCIVEMDDIFARLIKTLADSGQLENTLVLFTSDNGPEQEVPPYGRTPFRGGKGSTWEGGVRVPTFAYWKGTIAARRSEGLFDLADIFPTALGLAGKPGAALGRLVPPDRYVDGIDQTSFLVAPEGLSSRRSILYFLNDQISATRIDELKYMVVAQEPTALTARGQQGGFTGTVAPTAGATMFNLYTNPQEDDSVGVRHIPATLPLQMEIGRYRAVLKRFPSRIQIKL